MTILGHSCIIEQHSNLVGTKGQNTLASTRLDSTHLAPELIHAFAQTDDVLELAYVRADCQNITLAIRVREFLREGVECLYVDVRDGDFESQPVYIWLS